MIYFLLSVMVLGMCGGISYGLACCQSLEPRNQEAGLVQAAGEVDERYVPYTASEQRVITIELLAYEDNGADAVRQTSSSGGGGIAGNGGGSRMQADLPVTGGQASGQEYSAQAYDGIGTAQTHDAADAAQAHDAADAVQTRDSAKAAGTEAGTGTAQQTVSEDVEAQLGGAVRNEAWPTVVSDEDYEALLRIVQAEAGNEDTKGKILVANVVLNRVVDERFPNSVYEVVFQRAGGRAQFSPVASGSYYQVVVSEDTKEAVDRALAGEDYSEGALFFAARRYAGSSQMRWFDECLTKLFSYGGHEFFTS